ncbi:MAG: restriction endonuclease subunit S [Prevotella sp.]|nr:restriction endonuclease subunit S [Prevotella sp.]
MSKLAELIEKLCPNGVEYKQLYCVCIISKGVQFNKENMNQNGSYPVINGGITASGFIEQYNQDEDTITISQGGASAGYVNWQNRKFWAGAHCYVIKPLDFVNNRYLYHFIKSQEINLMNSQYGAGIPALSRASLEKIFIPIPPIEVQNEIASILDKVTTLEDELKNELECRKKQYEYYRDKLLSFDNIGIGGGE